MNNAVSSTNSVVECREVYVLTVVEQQRTCPTSLKVGVCGVDITQNDLCTCIYASQMSVLYSSRSREERTPEILNAGYDEMMPLAPVSVL
jgi:hypothetical protein